jgi:hypothetical protein
MLSTTTVAIYDLSDMPSWCNLSLRKGTVLDTMVAVFFVGGLLLNVVKLFKLKVATWKLLPGRM